MSLGFVKPWPYVRVLVRNMLVFLSGLVGVGESVNSQNSSGLHKPTHSEHYDVKIRVLHSIEKNGHQPVTIGWTLIWSALHSHVNTDWFPDHNLHVGERVP